MPEDEEQVVGGEQEEEVATGWAAEERRGTGSVFVDTGRGQSVEVQAGAPFVETLDRLAEQANYGGWFRIFLNGSEVVEPEDSPATIEPGMRLAITSYDKVG